MDDHTSQSLAETKPCRACTTQIPSRASRCPHCQALQSRVALLLIVLFCSAPLLILWPLVYRPDFQNHRGKLSVSVSQLTPDDGTVSIFGSIDNQSGYVWESPSFEIVLLDANGKQLDVVHEELYDMTITEGPDNPFRVRAQTAAPRGAIQRARVRIKGADRPIF